MVKPGIRGLGLGGNPTSALVQSRGFALETRTHCQGTYPQLPDRLRGSCCLMGGGLLGTCSLWRGLKSGTSQSETF